MPFKLIVQNSKVVLKSVANYIINASGIKDLLTGDSSIDSNGKIDWTLQHYSDTAANFTSVNPILLVGQLGIETDDLLTTPKFKIGDGVTVWSSLPYVSSGGSGNFVPYTGATQDVSLGTNSLNAKSLHIKGTGGSGHLGLKHQASNITANPSESSFGADSSGNPVWKNDGNAIDSLELQSNKTSTVTGNETSTSLYLTVKGVYDWVTGLFVKKSTLTANTIPKATASDTIGNSQITDDGTTVSIIDMKIGRGNGLVATNTGLGAQVFDAITTGSNNVAVGYASSKLTTTGQFNTSVGSTSLQNNTTGQLNTAVGFGALLSNTTGSFNEAFGYQALQSNTTGTDNCAFGYLTLNQNTTAMLNSGFGHAALQVNTTGTKNSGFGASALISNTTGSFNTAVGQQALGSLVNGDSNTSVGLNSLFNNNGSNNVALGFAAGFYETGSNKLFIDNTFRSDEADARAKALIYGIFDSTTANQRLRVNGVIGSSELTASQLIATDASKNLQSLDTATYPSLTELSYVKGVTSPLQTQLDGKVGIESMIINPGGTLNPADATTYYFGSFISTAPTTTAAARRVYLGKDCSIIGATFTLIVSSTLGTSEDINVYIRVNNTTDYSIGTIKANSSTQQILINTSMSIVLTSTDYFEIKMIMPTFATNPVTVSFSSIVNIR